MKPTLQQISDFGLAIIEREKYHTVKNKVYSQARRAKRYSKGVVAYTASVFFDYSRTEIANHLNIDLAGVSVHFNRVRNSTTKQEMAEELRQSLEILYGPKERLNREEYMNKLLPIFANENNSNVRTSTDLSKLENWLITRLYEIENK